MGKQPTYVEPKGRRFALELVLAQVIFTLFISVLALVVSPNGINQLVGFSALIGGAICTLGNLWLAMFAFRPALGSSPGKMLSAFYVAEIGKFVVTALLFLLAFKQATWLKQPSMALIMFVTYAMVQCSAWVYPLARRALFARQ